METSRASRCVASFLNSNLCILTLPPYTHHAYSQMGILYTVDQKEWQVARGHGTGSNRSAAATLMKSGQLATVLALKADTGKGDTALSSG